MDEVLDNFIDFCYNEIDNNESEYFDGYTYFTDDEYENIIKVNLENFIYLYKNEYCLSEKEKNYIKKYFSSKGG